MPAKTLYISQQFKREGRKLVPGQQFSYRSAREAVARTERDADRVSGSVAITTTVDDETGEVLEEAAVLVGYGELPAEFAGV